MSVASIKDLSAVSSSEFKKIIDSFDEVLCDCDGVLYFLSTPLPGVIETVNSLRNIGKSIRFVSNNCTLTKELFTKKLNKHGLNVKATDIVYPTWAIIAYLKKIKFDKAIYLFGTKSMRSELTSAGFKVAAEGPDRIEETVESLLNEMKDDEEIGAVIVDWGLNVNYIKLQKALIYLSRPEVLFINGATDKRLPIHAQIHLIGPNYFQTVIQEMSRRVPMVFGKPGLHMNDYIVQEFGIKQPNRTLFIGDSLHQDMAFASKCGYQKLLVMTGVTTMDEFKNTTSAELLPDYYVSNFGCIADLMQNKYSSKI